MIDITTTFAVISWKKEAYRIMIADKIKNFFILEEITITFVMISNDFLFNITLHWMKKCVWR